MYLFIIYCFYFLYLYVCMYVYSLASLASFCGNNPLSLAHLGEYCASTPSSISLANMKSNSVMPCCECEYIIISTLRYDVKCKSG